VDNIAIELQKRHSPNVVYAISEDPALDQKVLPLLEALKQTVGRGMGTVLSCIPGRLRFRGNRRPAFYPRAELMELLGINPTTLIVAFWSVVRTHSACVPVPRQQLGVARTNGPNVI